MKWKEFKTAAVVFLLPLLVLWGCQGNKLVSPTRVTSLSVSVPIPQNIKAALLGAATNEILYSVTSPGAAPVTGVYGPFSTPGLGGSVDFTIASVPTGPGVVLALQLNDASTHQALAIGASGLDAGVGLVTVELGSVARSCYVITASLATCSEEDDEEFSFNTYGYDDDNFYGGNPFEDNSSYTGVYYEPDENDVAFVVNNECNGYDIVDGWDGYHNSIAYMGNGNLVNFAYVPPDTAFFKDGATAKANDNFTLPDVWAQAGDVYCVKLSGGTTPGHAWLQILDAGDSGNGPTFCYRVNLTEPYYAYYQTPADLSEGLAGCSLVPDSISVTSTTLPAAN